MLDVKPRFAWSAMRTQSSFSGDAPLIDERNAHRSRRCRFSSLRQCLFGWAQIPSRRLVAAGGALQRHAALFEVQERIVSMETAQELPNLIGNHCPETPFHCLSFPV